MPNQGLEVLAEEISRICPTALIVASDYLAKDAELAARSGPAYDLRRTQDVSTQVKRIMARLESGTVLGKYAIQEGDIYNFDETGFQMGRVLERASRREQRRV